MTKTFFHKGNEYQFLFSEFSIDGASKRLALFGLLFFASALRQFIRYVRRVHCECSADDTTDIYGRRRVTKRHKFVQTILYTVQSAIGYLIMLSVLSFNINIIIAIIAGEYCQSNKRCH